MSGPDARGPDRRPLRFYLVAGEHSGDRLGAGLISALRSCGPAFEFAGVGGDDMRSEGLSSLFPMSDIVVMGMVPLRRIPAILRRIDDTAQDILAKRPDLVVIIDSPDFTHRVARKVRRLAPAIPIVDYVSPSVWAWRPGRAKAMRAYVDHLLALLPFEPEAHRRLGGPSCAYVGHPLIERLDVLRPNEAEAGVRARGPLLVLPGSRRTEIRRLTGIFGDTISRIVDRLGPIDIVLPAVEDHLREIEDHVSRWRIAPRIVTGEAAKLAAFRSARAALAASGTVTLELALSGVPMVVAYRVSQFENRLRFLIKVSSIVLPNLILGRNVIPEFIQQECSAERLETALLPLMLDGPERQRQLAAFEELDGLMRLDGGWVPSRKAAEEVLRTLSRVSSSDSGKTVRSSA